MGTKDVACMTGTGQLEKSTMGEEMCRRVAALDLGSQTFRMVIAECAMDGEMGAPEITLRLRKNVRLSQGMGDDGMLSSHAVERAMAVLGEFGRVLTEAGVCSVRAVATEVLRRAADAERFIDMARKRTGIDIEVIPWQTEAALAAYGAVSSLPDLPRPVAMIDVGGGSSEVVLHDGCEVKGAVSIPMGAVGLWEQMGRPGCFDAEAIAQLESAVLDRLSGVGLEDMGRARSAIATGGTATTAAAILHEMDEYDPSVVRGTPITISDMERMLREISSVPVANRYAIKGLEPERADIFPAGLAILKGIAITLGMDEIAVSDGGILLGVLLELLEKECRTDAELPSARGLYI